jgi:hypothetical protein
LSVSLPSALNVSTGWMRATIVSVVIVEQRAFLCKRVGRNAG